MYLSLHILSDFLAEFSPSILKSQKQQISISGINLYDRNTKMMDNILYIGPADSFFGDGVSKIACVNKSNVLMLDTEDIFSVLKKTLECFNYYSEWYASCESAISNNWRLHDLIDLFQQVFHNPIAVLNSDQKFVAYSPDYLNCLSINDKSNVLDHRSISDERLKDFNKKFKDALFRTDVHVIPAGFFPTKGYCKHIFLSDERVATVVCKARDRDYSIGDLHLVHIIAGFVHSWIQQNQHNKRITFPPLAYFTRTLEGDASALTVFVHELALLGWKDDCRKQFFLLGSSTGGLRLDSYQLQQLSDSSLGAQAIMYQEKIIILCNLDLIDESKFTDNLRDFMVRNCYYCTSSFIFTKQEKLIEVYKQVLTAFENSPNEISRIYNCQDVAMRMIVNIIDSHTPTDFRHPCLAMMKDYDALHRTEYYKTLITFLKNERRFSDTANELMIHRNTLAARIDKIKELWPLDLDNFELRAFLLFSAYREIL